MAICTAPGDQLEARMTNDFFHGAYVVWRDLRSGTSQAYLTRIGPDGHPASGWPENGIAVAPTTGSQTLVNCFTDGQWGTYVSWRDDAAGPRVFLQKYLPDGSVAPGWPEGGRVVSDSAAVTNYASWTDRVGGSLFVWFRPAGAVSLVKGVRLTADGVVAPGWGVAGIELDRVGTLSQDVCGTLGRTISAMVPAWPEGFYYTGRHAYFCTGSCHGCSSQNLVFAAIAAPSAAGIFATLPGYEFLSIAPDPITGQYFLLTDYTVTRYGWNGRLLDVGFRPYEFKLDGMGGYLMRGQSGSPYRYVVVRTTSEGYLLPGWPSGGRPVSTPQYNLRQMVMRTDGGGGSIFALEDSRPTTLPAGTADLYLQWLLPDGTPSPAQTPSGELLAATPWDESLFGAVENFAGDMIFGWSDTRNGNQDLWAYRFNTDLPVPTALALVASSATSNAVSLHWHAVDLEPGSEIQRRSPSSGWQALAAAVPDGDGDIRYVDRDVQPGARYGYRILVGGAGLGEVEVEVPRADRTMLAGATRNPAYDGVSASFSLAGDVSASVRLLDVTGREVARATARPTGGWQVVDLAGAGELAPGLYMIQLEAGGELHHRKVLVLR